jgi:hypothetical protein
MSITVFTSASHLVRIPRSIFRRLRRSKKSVWMRGSVLTFYILFYLRRRVSAPIQPPSEVPPPVSCLRLHIERIRPLLFTPVGRVVLCNLKTPHTVVTRDRPNTAAVETEQTNESYRASHSVLWTYTHTAARYTLRCKSDLGDIN